MAGYAAAVDRLILELGRLPGIGAKSAERLAHHILKAPTEEAVALAEAIRAVKDKVGRCKICHNLVEAEFERCGICRDEKRNPRVICIVEQCRDLMALEKAGSYSGIYHVLHGRLAPLQGMGPDQIQIDDLESRIRQGLVDELILATNPNLEGDGTALLVVDRLSRHPIKITRLARGLASGSTLEFANKEMLVDAFNGRQEFR